MSGIFISYRRSDAQDVAGRIFDRLIVQFTPSAVFKDVDNLPLGVSFREYIVHVIGASDAVLVLIGPTWLTCCDAQGRRRLDQTDDVVRLEIETALRLSRPTIPITVSHAQMPTASDLPEPVRDLVERNALAVRPDPDFNQDVRRLIQHLIGLFDPAGGAPEETQHADRPLLERLLQMIQGWHNDVIQTAAQLRAAVTDQEVQRITFLYLNTRNFLAQIVAMRKALTNRAWATSLESQLDEFLSFLTYREAPSDPRACRELHVRRHTSETEGLDLSDPRQLLALHSALQGVVDEVTALLAESEATRHDA